MEIVTRDVNGAMRTLVHTFVRRVGPVVENTYENPNGDGRVLRINQPVTVCYTHPRNRVLHNAQRDANPFFHLYESLWMLAGRNDLASVAYYNGNMKKFSDDGKTLNGAYGYRWRKACPTDKHYDGPGGIDGWTTTHSVDQLDLIVDMFKCVPNTRRAVLSMWNVEDDLLKAGCDLANDKYGVYSSKDICCNLNVMFELETVIDRASHGYEQEYDYLNITVTNRSNDLLWGMLGANYVQFSMLQEYLAARIGVYVGKYYHITNNLHVYHQREDWQPHLLLLHQTGDSEEYRPVPLVRDPEQFERELPVLLNHHKDSGWLNGDKLELKESFFVQVAHPMFCAFHMYKRENHVDAMWWIDRVQDSAWRAAGQLWLEKRSCA